MLKRIYQSCRIFWYRFISNCKNINGKPNAFHPYLIQGNGSVDFGKNVQVGVIDSPNFYSHYAYLEARNQQSKIIIDDEVSINNAFSAVAFTLIHIQKKCLIGVNCSIMDNDGHSLHPEKRNSDDVKSMPVIIEENVFLGDNVTILKGVTIGRNAVIGSGSVVTKSIPENVIAAGNPARVIRNL